MELLYGRSKIEDMVLKQGDDLTPSLLSEDPCYPVPSARTFVSVKGRAQDAAGCTLQKSNL